MTVLPIVIAPDPRLKQKSQPVAHITPELLQLMEDMLETMYASNGIGLAAVQVGVLRRVIVADTTWESPRYREGRDPQAGIASRTPIRMINPEIVRFTEERSVYNEGCLSFPGQYAEVERPASVTIRYLNERGEQKELTAEGLLATCLQHELDHMDGIVFVDHISRLKREMILRRLKKAKKQGDHHHHHHDEDGDDHHHCEHC
jgi:peptide deformylase